MTPATKVSVGIIGGAGYTGGETLRLLLQHPGVEVRFIQSRSQAGKPVTAVHRDLTGDTSLNFVAEYQPADVYILCLGHGESRQLLTGDLANFGGRIIDLGNDFRVDNQWGSRQFVYGLPELNREKIRSAKWVANPGCFATAITLALLPVASKGLLGEVHVTGITGSTGAGQKLQDTTHFTWRADNISAYKTLTHQHLAEIRQSLTTLMPAYSAGLHFIPWRGNFARGIFVSASFATDLPETELRQLYATYYQDCAFTHLTDQLDMKQVVNTNKCLLAIERVGRQVVVHAAIDNLLKGAAGQAVQNLNLMFQLEETLGLKLKPAAF